MAPDPDDIAATVRWLRDRELVRDVPLRYARSIDARDWDMLRSCFHPDARIKGATVEHDAGPYLEFLIEEVPKYDATLHFMGNQYVEVDGDTATCETYAVAYHMEAVETRRKDLVMGVRYCDDLVYEGGTWLILRREAVAQWVRGPLPPPPGSD